MDNLLAIKATSIYQVNGRVRKGGLLLPHLCFDPRVTQWREMLEHICLDGSSTPTGVASSAHIRSSIGAVRKKTVSLVV